MRRGFTLAEMMVALALGALLSVFFFQALIGAVRLTRKAGERSKAQMEATVVWNSLVRDLQSTASEQIILADLATQGQGLLFPTLESITAAGTREWSNQQVMLHWNPTSKELRRRLVVDPEVDAARPGPEFLALLNRPAGPSGRTLSNCLKSFRASITAPAAIDLALTFEVSSGQQWDLSGTVGTRN